tara:strand:- start:706 stop:1164 length:459 start_codon:yes stop_codon:yes gene_type:complete
MKNNLIESGLGLITAIISIAFLFQFIQVNKSNTSQNTYSLKAKFLKAGGIVVGNDVKIRGVKVGVVTNVSLDNELLAEVSFKINSSVKITSNSSISVSSDGLLGNKYLSILPGSNLGQNESQILNEFDEIKFVNDYESIEDQVSKIIFLATQ